MSSWTWYLTRSTGIVAAVLSVAALMWGFFFSSRNTGNRLKPNWWLALHNWLGGLTLTFVALHMLLAFFDGQSKLAFKDLFIPSGKVGWAIGWGVVSFWMFVLVVLPSIARIRRRLPRKTWHLVHLLAVPATVLGMVHAFQAGSDSAASYFTRGLALLVGLGMYPLSIRLIGIAEARRRTAAA